MKKHSLRLLFVLVSIFSWTGTSLGISITPTNDANTLVTNILGTGITVVGSPAYTGVTNQSGTFTGGNVSGVGFDSGILMTSGNVNQVPGPNNNGIETVGVGDTTDDDISTALGTGGDAQLTALAGNATFNAAALQFDFQFGDGSVGGDLFFNFVFASEEYVDYIGSQFNDVFGFFVDGSNIALVPGTSTPITVNNLNNSVNSAFYKNNVNNTNGIPNLGLDLSFDGLSTVITAQLLGLSPGVHNMKFAVSDTSDEVLDAGVFIQSGTFSPEPPVNQVPEPASLFLMGSALVGLGLVRRLRKDWA